MFLVHVHCLISRDSGFKFKANRVGLPPNLWNAHRNL